MHFRFRHSSRTLAAAFVAVCLGMPVAAQDAVVIPGEKQPVTPRAAKLDDIEQGSVSDRTLLDDGRYREALRFRIDEWRLNAGRFDLSLDVATDFPLELTLFHSDYLSKSRETLDDRRALSPQVLDKYRYTVAVTRPGWYVLVVTSAAPATSGRYRIGINTVAEPPKAMNPIPDMKAIEPRLNYFTNLSLSATRARFGEHVTLTPSMTDIPTGCTWQATTADVQGLLPPGLRLQPKSTVIDGTPRQLGTWSFVYSLRGIHCTAGPGAYGDRSVSVTFTVVP